MTERHVRKDPDGGWNVTDRNGSHVNSHHKTEVQAVAWAKTVLRNRGVRGTVVVHERDGTTRAEQV